MPDLPFPCPILVVAPQPDDETLACGALLASCWERGAPAHVLCMTDGGASHPSSSEWPPERLAARRFDELREAVRLLGGQPARDITWLGYPDASLAQVQGPAQDPCRDIVERIDATGARTVIFPSPRDPHTDHIATASVCERALADRSDIASARYSVWLRWNERDDAETAPRAVSFTGDKFAKAAAIAAHASQRGSLVEDAPDGFTFPPGFAAFFADSPEVFEWRTQ